ncbi:D-alanyl-D-alanine carboxypeptidase family protein [Leifsonia sp. 2MCAF36]|uniref:D-alanyl-D-alanine carboxypeptidase family protein n=1 Tax=Leifsonia sp. 2MCAF36 TaxID=3232988 RepID=UPI003F96D7EB
MINLQWGSQRNGQLDTSTLIDVSGRGDYLEPTAAVQWRNMAAACKAATGVAPAPAPGSSAYRPLSIQKDFYATYLRDGSPVAAVPGTSNHGWGRAVDMTGYEGNSTWRSPRTGHTYAVDLTVWSWLQAHAAGYGYDWATGDGSGEAWHWESLTPAGTASLSASFLTGGFLMALSDDEQAELLQKIRELRKIELVPGQGYSWGNAASNAAQAAVDALTKPSLFRVLSGPSTCSSHRCRPSWPPSPRTRRRADRSRRRSWTRCRRT